MTWIRMTGSSRVTGMTKMARVFSILPAFEKSVCSELGEFCLIANIDYHLH